MHTRRVNALTDTHTYTHMFTLQMAAACEVGPDSRLEPETVVSSSTVWQRPKHLSHFPLPFQMHQLGAGLEAEYLELQPALQYGMVVSQVSASYPIPLAGCSVNHEVLL